VFLERATSPGVPGPVRRRAVRPGVVYAGVLVLLIVVTRMFVLEPHVISSASMAPTLVPGDVVIANKLGPSLSGVHRGDIVIFPSPDGNGRLIKRVVATGGQSVGLYGGALVVDGNAVDEPHVNSDQLGGIFFGPVTVPAGQVFLMGDNRLESVDSRQFGAVGAERVEATVLLVLPFG
jgi:signal peptidase I